MEMQNQIKEYVALYESEVRKLADQLRNECMPQPTEELFSEFETNGNRMRYEAVYFGRRKFLSVLGLASVIWHEKEDIQKLEEVIREICAEECWALPAHVRRKENPNWRGVIDLFASETGQALAHLTTLLKDELSEEVITLAQNEVKARILKPFIESKVPYASWEQATNNWNAVCCGNVGSAALLLMKEGTEKKKLLERLNYALENYYLEGFWHGWCMRQEGLGYWVYGFTYFYISDGDSRGTYPMGLTCCLADQYSDIRFPDTLYAQKLDGDSCWRWIGIYWNWYWTHRYLDDVQNKKAEEPKPLEQSGMCILQDAQWCILRGAKQTAVIAKGGNNGESHNHNDVGSFQYLADGEAFLDDLGAGEYTKDYFSEKRYEIFCNRGESHNIPIIGDVDQKAGKEYCADRFELTKDRNILISFAKAYGIEAQKVYREIWLDENTGKLTVCDYIQCRPGVEVHENLVTRLPVSVENDSVVIRNRPLFP